MRRMAKVTGRTDDMLIIRGVNLFPSQIEELLLADQRLAPHYLLEVSKAGPLDHLKVLVEAKGGASGAEQRRSAAAALGRHIKSRLGIQAEIEVLPPGQIERSLGKARRVRDLR
jgi:phenylacetate-CoA ligase